MVYNWGSKLITKHIIFVNVIDNTNTHMLFYYTLELQLTRLGYSSIPSNNHTYINTLVRCSNHNILNKGFVVHLQGINSYYT